MDQLQIPAFGGVAGRVLKEAFSFQTWFTGFMFGTTVFVFAYMLGMMGVEDSGFFLAHALIPIIVCRYALNGYHGEWGGSVFSTRGGSWLEVGLVTWRYIALTLLWLIPLTLMGADPGSRMPSGVTVLYMTVWVISPPVLLIVSIAAPNFASVFMPQTWQDTFRGRVGDLLSLYVVYTGVVTCLSLLLLPVAFGLWGIFHGSIGISVGTATGMILGIVVDNTVHFLSKYQRAKREKSYTSEQAVSYAFATVGTALWVTTFVLVAGFLVLALSEFNMNAHMGIFTSLTITLALIFDFIALPALLLKLDKEREEVKNPVPEPA